MALTPSTTHCGHPGSRGAPVPTSTTLRREAGPKVGAMLERRAEIFEGPCAGKYHCSSDENHDAQQTHLGAAQTGSPQYIAARVDDAGPLSKSTMWIVAAVALIIILALGLGFLLVRGGGSARSPLGPSVATFVGNDTCAQCHPTEAKLWRTSQHKQAMEYATDASVLGDFNDASFSHYGVHSRFFRKDGKFFVETDGPDGKLATFEVKYTFGVDPLQQYLIEFPDGRLQALSIAWDARPKEQGGQRWFHLYPNEEIKRDDVLHWTKL